MQYQIICVGKIKEKFYAEAVQEYTKRLSRYARITITEVSDEKTPDGASFAEEMQIKKKEAERILSRIRDDHYVIALDISGKECDSVGFSRHLDSLMTRGKSQIVFIIGGSLGLHPSVLHRANESVSFSKMTFPHPLMRVILMEQIYRATKIQRGEPYHK